MPLGQAAACGVDGVSLRCRLDALGNDLQVQRIAQPDDRAVQRLDPVGLRADRQTTVELDDLHRQRVQIGQRVVARAEVVKGEQTSRYKQAVDGLGR